MILFIMGLQVRLLSIYFMLAWFNKINVFLVCFIQFFEPIQLYTLPTGAHPLEVQALNPVYTWLICVICYFMLISVTGLIVNYDTVAEQVSGSSHGEEEHGSEAFKQNIVYGLIMVIPGIILLKMLEKVYYRHKLLPGTVFAWVERLYKAAEDSHHEEVLNSFDTRAGTGMESEVDHEHFRNTYSASTVVKFTLYHCYF
jgi:hypothetical protein